MCDGAGPEEQDKMEREAIKCPADTRESRRRNVGNMGWGVCPGRYGGIWFGQNEPGSMSAMAASRLHAIWSLKRNPCG